MQEVFHADEWKFDGRSTRQFKETVVCRFDGCHSPAKSAGLCKTHYQFVRYKESRVELLPEEYRTERCRYPDCDEVRYAKGLCRSHYGARFRHGHPGGLFEERDVNAVRVRTALIAQQIPLTEVGAAMGISGERVRQIIQSGRWRRAYLDVLCEMLDLPAEWFTRDGPPEFDLSK